jgi:cell division protein FtsQ
MPATIASLRSKSRRSNTVLRPAGRDFLEVRVRKATARRQRFFKVCRWTWYVMAMSAMIIGTIFSFRLLVTKFFLQNADYNLAHVIVTDQPYFTPEEIREMANLQLGENVFLIDLQKVETKITKFPEVAQVAVRRELPDAIKITLQMRKPVAWAGTQSKAGPMLPTKLIDQTGTIYEPSVVLPSQYQLPIIYGIKLDELAAGSILHTEELRRALELLSILEHTPDSLLVIRSIDISKGWSFEVINDRNTRILFSPGSFPQQLEKLQSLLVYSGETGREIESINLMTRRNTPVRFVFSSMNLRSDIPANPNTR